LLPHRPDGFRVIGAAEDGRSRNERIGAGLGDGSGIIDLDPPSISNRMSQPLASIRARARASFGIASE